MKGRQNPQPTLFACVRLEQMIPPNLILRRIQQAIDFSFIDRLTAGLYSTAPRDARARKQGQTCTLDITGASEKTSAFKRTQ